MNNQTKDEIQNQTQDQQTGMELLKGIERLGTYQVVEHHDLKDVGCEGYVLRHKKSGARIALLPNGDNNKVFFIGFRTPPTDSTGVAHIIEHTVLCGSREFPVKDPFIEVAKGSLNTFLNAMTYPDKTMYPVASTNEKDFANLMHIYLDAVFHPNIYTNENIFRQEGWHYEVRTAAETDTCKEDASDSAMLNNTTQPAGNGEEELIINGVVYNEMKGVMSSPDDVLNDAVLASLYPDTTYSIVSGGDPAVIPELTYQQYLDFHSKFYHPSNSYIYLYGDMDVLERLEFLDQHYLSDYDVLEVDSAIHAQEPFDKPVEKKKVYSILTEDDPKDKTFLSWNAALPIHGDVYKILAFKVLDYVLCDAEGAPVKEALRGKGIGQNVESLYESGIYEPYYSISAKYANPQQQQEFEQTIVETLQGLVQNGIDKKALLAGINYHEFHYREADFGAYPKGLIYGLDIMDTWLYDEDKVWDNLELGSYFDRLKKAAEEGFFEQMIQEYLLNNTHRSVVLLVPEQGLTERMEKEQKERLAQFAAGLKEEELQTIKDAEGALRAWQNQPDTKEAMASIPVLERGDLTKEPQLPVTEIVKEENGFTLLTHPVFTHGIDYLDLSFEVTDLDPELLRYTGIFKILMGAMDTENYTYRELDNEINIATGGISPCVSNHKSKHRPPKVRILFELSVKTMDSNLDMALELARELIFRTRWEDTGRMREVLEEERASMKAELQNAGHSTAVLRASAMLSADAAVMDDLTGVGNYRFLDDLCEHFEEKKETIVQKMKELCRVIFQKDRFLGDLTAEKSAVPAAEVKIKKIYEELPGAAGEENILDHVRTLQRKANPLCREGLSTAGQVQFVCCAGSYGKKGLPFKGSLRVLKVILGYDYLWTKVRMLGGAYGCMSGFARDGIAYFVSYRDPKLEETMETFREAAEYIRSFEAEEKAMTKYVIGAISALDRPITPSMLGRYSKSCILAELTAEDLQRERLEILNCTQQDIQDLGEYVASFMEDDAVCVVGSAAKLKEHAALFDRQEALV